eukprot:COSAG05_NODE_28543_length_122_cov_150.434783_1_plen_40_part_11
MLVWWKLLLLVMIVVLRLLLRARTNPGWAHNRTPPPLHPP